MPALQFLTKPADWWETVLGVAGFEKLPQIDGNGVPVTASMTPSLGVATDLCEVWRVSPAEGEALKNGPTARDGEALSNGPAARGRVRHRYCGEFLFGSITIDERTRAQCGAPRATGDAAALLKATETAYQEIFAVLEETDHRHLIRIWNYLPEINRDADGDERYRHFNAARHAAFRTYGHATVGSVPAASALGSPAGSPISIYFIASRRPPLMIENPRQTSAYYYPRKFGMHRPIFSRACMLRESAGTNLFVSGTASIIGHETTHPGDVAAQTRETLANIDALVQEANRAVGTARYSLEGLKFKVYVRRPTDLGAIEAALAGSLRAAVPVLYLQADVCREELLVEIEATGESGVRAARSASHRRAL